MKELLLAWINRPLPEKPTLEQQEFEMKRNVIYGMLCIVVGGFFAFVYSVTFTMQPMGDMAPIDKQFLMNIKDIMLLCIGSLGTIASQQGYKAYQAMKAIEEAKASEEPKDAS